MEEAGIPPQGAPSVLRADLTPALAEETEPLLWRLTLSSLRKFARERSDLHVTVVLV